MNTDILLASGPPRDFLFLILKALLLCFVCPLLVLSFFIASMVLFAQKKRKPAELCALLGFLSIVLSLALWLIAVR